MVGQALNDLAAQQGALHDLVAVLGLDANVHDAQRLDVDKAAHFTEAMAAAHLDM